MAEFATQLQGILMLDVMVIMEKMFEKEKSFKNFSRSLFMDICGGISFERVAIDPDSVARYLANVDTDTRSIRNSHIAWLNTSITLEEKMERYRTVGDLKSQVAHLKNKQLDLMMAPTAQFCTARIRKWPDKMLFQDINIKKQVDLISIASKFEGSNMEGSRYIRSFTTHMMCMLFPPEVAPMFAATKSTRFLMIGDDILSKVKDLLIISLGCTPSLELDYNMDSNIRDAAVRHFENSRKKRRTLDQEAENSKKRNVDAPEKNIVEDSSPNSSGFPNSADGIECSLIAPSTSDGRLNNELKAEPLPGKDISYQFPDVSELMLIGEAT